MTAVMSVLDTETLYVENAVIPWSLVVVILLVIAGKQLLVLLRNVGLLFKMISPLKNDCGILAYPSNHGGS